MTTSASSVRPDPVVTNPAPAASTVSSVSISTPCLRYSSVTKSESVAGRTREAIPCSGNTIVTRQPFAASEAAISEPMKPPPITMALVPSCTRARTAR